MLMSFFQVFPYRLVEILGFSMSIQYAAISMHWLGMSLRIEEAPVQSLVEHFSRA